MSKINVRAFFRFCKVKVIRQTVNLTEGWVRVVLRPDGRYLPRCHKCGSPVRDVHCFRTRAIRDLNIFDVRVFLKVIYRVLRCPGCGFVVEDLGLFDPYRRVTRRLERYILELCRLMSIKEVAEHLALSWKTIKAIHKASLVKKFYDEDIGMVRIIMVDEISIRKRHRYLTLVVDWETGRVLWIGKGRRYETLKGFFDSLTPDQREPIEAVAMDMWDPYIRAVKEGCPSASIVFDRFHVISQFNRVIDKVRNAEYRKATGVGKEVIKGSKYLLLKRAEHLTAEERPKLSALLELNEALNKVYVLKEYLGGLWQQFCPEGAMASLEHWCELAYESGIRALRKFATMLKRHAYGIINHCFYPIHTSKMEGINNKIKVIKRRAYGFHDTEYFCLVIKDAFASTN